jgi:HAD superfamily hydrolase (TIGR01484 family)
MKKYDTLIFDLDGTLAVSKQPLDDQTATLLSETTHQLNVVIITGGHFDQIKLQVINQLNSSTNLENFYILPTSGSSMRKYNTQKNFWDIVYDNQLTKDQKKRIILSLENALERASFTIDPNIIIGEQIEDRNSQITLSALGQKQLPKVKALWDPAKEKRRELITYMSDLKDEFDIRFGGGTSIDITLKGIDKEYGIRQFYKHTHFKIENGLFVGDQIVPGGNDFAATKTGIDTRKTTGPGKTIEIINSVLIKHN